MNSEGDPILIIGGPTASGKSALALDLALRLRGVVINADSMQVYKELRILSARPTLADEELVPHRLYGHVEEDVRRRAVEPSIQNSSGS